MHPRQQAEGCWHILSGQQAEQAFAVSLLQSVTEVMGLKSVSEVGIQTAEYDGSPLSLALQKLEETYLKQSQVMAFCRNPVTCSSTICWALAHTGTLFWHISRFCL